MAKMARMFKDMKIEDKLSKTQMNISLGGSKAGLGYEDYKEFLGELLERIDTAFGEEVLLSFALFGSVARKEAKPDSDLDLLAIHKPVTFDSIKRFVEVLLELRKGEKYLMLLKKGIYPEPMAIFMTPEEISYNPLILLDIMDHGIILLDREGFLQGKMSKLKWKLKEMGARKIIFENGSWAWDLKPDWKPGELIEIVI